MTHKSSLEVPTPAVVEKTNKHGSQEITNQKRYVRCHGIRYDQADKLLQRIKQSYIMTTFQSLKYFIYHLITEYMSQFSTCMCRLVFHCVEVFFCNYMFNPTLYLFFMQTLNHLNFVFISFFIKDF